MAEQNDLTKETIKSIAGSLLLVNERPLSIKELIQVLDVDKKTLEQAVEELIDDYRDLPCGICIVKVAGGYQMCSVPDNAEWIKKLYREKNKQKLSTPSLETLSIIAYKQPVTKMEVEAIRGVNVDNILRNLCQAGLLKTEGRKEVPGRPFLYVTTRKFLEYFGLNSLKDLPKLEEFTADGAEIPPDALNVRQEEGLKQEEKQEETQEKRQDETPDIQNDVKQDENPEIQKEVSQ